VALEGELPEIELTLQEIEVPGGVSPVPGLETTVSLTFMPEIHKRLGLPHDSYSAAKVHDLKFAAISGTQDLAFIRSLVVKIISLEDHSAGKPGTQIGRYERRAGSKVSRAITMINTPPVDILNAWQSQTPTVTLAITGTLPEAPFKMTALMHLSATLKHKS
jgi:hypothetical protein